VKRIALIFMAAALIILPLVVTACGPSQADVASSNISKAAEQFEVARRIVAINGITDKYLLEIEGYCSVETSDSGLSGALEVTCKIAPGQYKKVFIGLSDNVTYTVQQIDPIDVSTSHYRVLFRPGTIVPDFANHR
jgi:hypothetical protein